MNEGLAMPKELPEPDVLPAKRGRGHPAHAPTKADRDMITMMVAGGITQADIARAKGIDLKTLRKHYREELDNGATSVNTMVLAEHLKLIKKGDFQAIRWWQQSRMSWRSDVVDPAKLPEQSTRVVVEFVGEPAAKPVTIDHAPLRPDDRDGRDVVRRNVQLVG
jgi:hypothetical protein